MKKEYIPRYMRIKNHILDQIASGELKKGDRLPTEPELASLFRVSRITVVGALRELVNEDWIYKKHGSGSYVKKDTADDQATDIFARITGTPKTIISFGLYNAKPNYEFLIKTAAGIFQLENPDIKVDVTNIRPPADGQDDAYLRLLREGQVPTVGEFYLHSAYAAADALLPLDNLSGFSALEQSLRPQCTYQTLDSHGQPATHAIATKVTPRIIMVNVDLLRQAGITNFDCKLDMPTLRQWIRQVGTYTQNSHDNIFGCHIDRPLGWYGVTGNIPYLWQGVRDYQAEAIESFDAIFQTEECFQGLHFLRETFEHGNPAPYDGLDLFATGRVGIALSSSTWPLVLNEMMFSKFNLHAYEIPSIAEGTPFQSVLGGFSVGIFRHAARTDSEIAAAWQWIKFLLSPSMQKFLCTDYSIPARKNQDCLLANNYPNVHRVIMTALQHSRPQFDFPGIRQCLCLLGNNLNNYLENHDIPAESICAELRRELAASLLNQ